MQDGHQGGPPPLPDSLESTPRSAALHPHLLGASTAGCIPRHQDTTEQSRDSGARRGLWPPHWDPSKADLNPSPVHGVSKRGSHYTRVWQFVPQEKLLQVSAKSPS